MMQSNKAKKTTVETGKTIPTPNHTFLAVTEMTGSIGAEEESVADESKTMAEATDGSPTGACNGIGPKLNS